MLGELTLIFLLALGGGFVVLLVFVVAKEMEAPQPHPLGPTRAELLQAHGYVQRS